MKFIFYLHFIFICFAFIAFLPFDLSSFDFLKQFCWRWFSILFGGDFVLTLFLLCFYFWLLSWSSCVALVFNQRFVFTFNFILFHIYQFLLCCAQSEFRFEFICFCASHSIMRMISLKIDRNEHFDLNKTISLNFAKERFVFSLSKSNIWSSSYFLFNFNQHHLHSALKLLNVCSWCISTMAVDINCWLHFHVGNEIATTRWPQLKMQQLHSQHLYIKQLQCSAFAVVYMVFRIMPMHFLIFQTIWT